MTKSEVVADPEILGERCVYLPQNFGNTYKGLHKFVRCHNLTLFVYFVICVVL